MNFFASSKLKARSVALISVDSMRELRCFFIKSEASNGLDTCKDRAVKIFHMYTVRAGCTY